MARFACVVGILVSSFLSGCAAVNSIHWSFPGAGDSQVLTTDAKQRHLILTNDASAGPGEKIRVCAEASPDVFSALSSSLSGGLGIGSPDRKAEAASALAETVATIERTQTINLLRESMYRTCERWLSGALSKPEFLALAARDHRSMIAILAIEQLTGVVKPPSTVISGPATRAVLAQTELLVKVLDGYRAERIVAEKAEAEATAQYDAVNVEVSNADGSKSKVCSLAAAPAGNETVYAKCKPAADKVQAAKALSESARSRESAVLKDLGKLSGGISAGTEAGSFNAGGLTSTSSRVGDAALIALSTSVERIALTAGIDEALMFCISYLGQTGKADTTRDMCNAVVANRARQDQSVQQELLQLSLTPEFQETYPIGQYWGAFKARLLIAIVSTPAANLSRRIAAFEQRAGATVSATSLCAASTPQVCANTVGGRDLYLRDFAQSRLKFETALNNWNVD